ncbi:3-oxoacyl-ACP synthase [Amycolatopsis sp. WAC 01376]|uniref:3-oxoacyl-[acyl-carrier-protein] synthase III C-terminal domain-containing protein n=1 Tax=Amycolatopsis sp. WAC 01376 TaxID=2203195 RepID=UPI000F7B9EC1|nr:3-oxoacyl-[acyl-carrier-protein] synthase III C-terminal domain-containing protein [Amycolatopsis sp. WAC 01376]RSM62499.1 3-oxoacyl-ACP synthase [Amycolatopsis sp. WAC 01376]
MTTDNGSGAIGIGAMHCLLPEDRMAVTDLPEYAQLGHEELAFVEKCGVRTVGVFTETSQAALAGQACRELLAEHPVDPDILLMVGPRSPDVLLGSDVCRVQAENKLDSAFAFSVDGLGCTGSSAAWALARDLLVADPGRESVLITHTSRPTGADRIRFPVTVVGDGAYAMTMVRGGRPVLRGHRQETDGSFNDLFRVDYKQTPWYEWREECLDPARYSFELATHSQFRLSRLVDRVLAEAGIGKDAVATTLMQNVAASAFGFYTSLLELPIHDVCLAQLTEYGHLGAMDVVLNLDRLLATGELAEGDLVLVLNNSPVAAWAVTLWEV